MTRQWTEDEFELSGLRLRVVPGRKTPKGGDHVDRKIEWLTPLGWRPIRFYDVGVICDFLMWNEDGLYPPQYGNRGGRKVLDYLAHAYRHDVDRAEAGLQAERAAKRQHPNLFDAA